MTNQLLTISKRVLNALALDNDPAYYPLSLELKEAIRMEELKCWDTKTDAISFFGSRDQVQTPADAVAFFVATLRQLHHSLDKGYPVIGSDKVDAMVRAIKKLDAAIIWERANNQPYNLLLATELLAENALRSLCAKRTITLGDAVAACFAMMKPLQGLINPVDTLKAVKTGKRPPLVKLAELGHELGFAMITVLGDDYIYASKGMKIVRFKPSKRNAHYFQFGPFDFKAPIPGVKHTHQGS